jgi:hypothetical protein
MRDCRTEPGSFPKVHLFLVATEEHAQGVKFLCDPRVKQEGNSGRSGTPSCGERVCRRLPRGVTWDVAGEGIGVYYRPKTGD